MNVLFLRTDFFGATNVGGSFSHVRGFLSGLQTQGHNVCVVSSGALSLGSAFETHEIPYPPLYRNLPEVLSVAYNFSVLRSVQPIVEQFKPEFLYHRHSEFNFASSILAQRNKIPLVLEFNGSEYWVKKNWGKTYLGGLLLRSEEFQLRRADIIAVVSQVIKDQLVASGIPQRKVLVNPNGVDTDLFQPGLDGMGVRKKFGLERKFVAGFVGTFGAWHGVEVLARAVKPAVEKNPNVHFLIIGDGNLRGEVERILREDNVEQYATLTGSVAHDDVPRYLAACDILLSPHVQNADGTTFFGSPTKLFEYMGMGKPIVASAVGQIADVIRDGENGVTMRHRDHADLAAQIQRLAQDAGLCARLGAAARHSAIEQFSWKRNASRVLEAVQSLPRASR